MVARGVTHLVGADIGRTPWLWCHSLGTGKSPLEMGGSGVTRLALEEVP